ncbi:MAG: DNA repair protein RadA [Chlamydiae bacterium]|nr:DNA repair protein RadA [Chlamydiota bacterium]
MGKDKLVWMCRECGHSQVKWSGSCISCNNWNTFVEHVIADEKKMKFAAQDLKMNGSVRLKDISLNEFSRHHCKITEFDRLLGGGVVKGSLILIGGDPGVGKSTLLLQISEAYASQGLKVLYVCGEESVEQTSLRAGRLGIKSDNLYLLSETLFRAIKLEIDKLKPNIIIVDSVQILYKDEIPSSPGSVVQVREIAMEFMHIAKGYGITTFMIGHVTKSGEIAGPKVLEHIVDTVLDFEGERQIGFRLLRSVKNRFGPTDDIALFQMKEDGLKEVANPSEAFLRERMRGVAGSSIVPTIEGVRSLLIEIQALVTPTSFSNPSRKSTGLDQNRLALLLAVLEKRVGYQLHNCDVFVSVAGGLKIKEPAIDLGILLAIASSFTNRILDPDTVCVGEVGLGGEIRSVSRIESRIKEAINMGFKKCLFPKKCFKEISKNLMDKIELVGADIVDEAIHEVL